MRENPDLRDEIEVKVREFFVIPVITASEESETEAAPKPSSKK